MSPTIIDNQVLFLTFSKSKEASIQAQHDLFMDRLSTFLATIGPPIKADESWSSTAFFTYGKMPILKGVPLSMSLKKLCRMFRLNNDDLVNLDSTLGSIASNAASATKMSATPLVPLWVAMFESLGATYNFLKYPFYHTNFDKRINRRGDLMDVHIPRPQGGTHVKSVALPDWVSSEESSLRYLSKLIISVPSALGGFSTTMMNDLLLHGFPDPVTLSIHEVKTMIRGLGNRKTRTTRCLKSILSPEFNPFVNPVLLMENPTSLNLLQGSRCKDRVRALVFRQIQDMPNIRNPAFRKMLSLAEIRQDVLAESLYNMTPLKPRVGNSIYESTIPSQAMAMVRRIDRTSTLINITARARTDKATEVEELEDTLELRGGRRMPTFLEIFGRFENQHMAAVISCLFREDIQDNEGRCGTTLAQNWRKDSWEKELEGVTVPFPSEVFKRGMATI